MQQGPLEIGSLIDGRHRLERILGVGGFATVYLGIDIESERNVAIKVLNQPMLHRARFEREIEAVSQLRDPHTVRLFSHGETSGTPYIIFEFVPGRDLDEVLKDAKRLAAPVVEHVLRQLLMSLREAHRTGVVHRDLKPANVRVFPSDDDPWRVKLLDFGIAGFERPQDAKLTKTGELVGTPKYMSPEQLTGSKVGPSGDIYSLGMVALEMLVGLDDMHGSRWSDQLDRLQSGHLFAFDSTHAHLDKVLAKMTARNPLHRFQSAEAVLHALDNPSLLAAPKPQVRPRLQSETSTARPGRASGSPEANRSAPPDPDRDPRLAIKIGAFALVALALCIVAIVWVSSDAEPPAAPTSSRNLGTMIVGGEVEPVDVPSPQPDQSADDPRPGWAQVEPARSGCGGDRAPSGITPRSIQIPGMFGKQLRNYVVRVPTAYDPDRAYPVWLLFQTVVFDPIDFIAMASLEEFADEHGIVLLGFEKRNAMDMFEDVDKALVANAVAATQEDLCIDRSRVFGFSHGKGGNFVRKVACGLELAAIATIGDWAQRGPHCAKPVPYIKFSGDDDLYSRPTAGETNCVGEGPVLSREAVDAAWRAHNRCTGDEVSWGGQPTKNQCVTWTCATPYVTCHYPGGHFFPRGKLELPFDPCEAEQPDFPIVDVALEFFDTVAPGPTDE